MMLDTIGKSQKMHRQLAQHIFAEPLVTFSVPGPQPLPDSYNNSYVTQVSRLAWCQNNFYLQKDHATV